MASLSLLIAGRGFPALFAARLAETRGYRTTLLLDPDSAPLSLVMVAGGGILSRLESEAGAALSPTPPLPLPTPAFLSLGEPARYLGASPPVSPPSPEEATRFLYSLEASLAASVFPELARTMALCHEKTSTPTPLLSRLVNWILEPEREKERLSRKLSAEARGGIRPVESLLSSLLPLAGLSGKSPVDPESLRVLQNLLPSRMIAVSPLGAGSVAPGDVRLWRGQLPAVLEMCSRGRRVRIAGEPEEFDRLLLLTDSPDPAFVSGVLNLDAQAIPPHWPPFVHLPPEKNEEGKGEVFLAIEPSVNGAPSRGWLWSELLPGETPARTLLAAVDRFNARTILPALDRSTLVRRELSPLLSMEGISLRGLRKTTSYLQKGGAFLVMGDPTLLPLVTEDFWADLSLALPARKGEASRG